jgi:hypothetical protein
LYHQHTKKFFSVLTIRPRFVGLVARPRAATLPIKDFHHYASGKAGGRCAPRLATAVLGLAARGRPARRTPSHSRRARARLLALGSDKAGARTPNVDHMPQPSAVLVLASTRQLCARFLTPQPHLSTPHQWVIGVTIVFPRRSQRVATASGSSPTTPHHRSLGEPRVCSTPQRAEPHRRQTRVACAA